MPLSMLAASQRRLVTFDVTIYPIVDRYTGRASVPVDRPADSRIISRGVWSKGKACWQIVVRLEALIKKVALPRPHCRPPSLP